MAQAWQSFLRFELQASMAHKEERARAAEVPDRTLLIADYEAQLAAHASEIQALREELEQRTSVLQAEMDRWGSGGSRGTQGDKPRGLVDVHQSQVSADVRHMPGLPVSCCNLAGEHLHPVHFCCQVHCRLLTKL